MSNTITPTCQGLCSQAQSHYFAQGRYEQGNEGDSATCLLVEFRRSDDDDDDWTLLACLKTAYIYIMLVARIIVNMLE